MNLHQLRVFCEVARMQSFRAAAEKLHLTQPAVTWQIRSLEDFYDLKFFERLGKKIILTEEGRTLFENTTKLLQLSDQTEEALNDFKELSRGTLRIGAVFYFGSYFLPPLVEAFYMKYPNITLQINTGNTSLILENTLLHQNDIAFVSRNPKDDKLVSRKYINDIMVGAVSLNHPLAGRQSISLKELQGQPLILRERSSSKRRMVDEFLKKKGVSPKIILESASIATIKKMVGSGLGIAILPRQAIKKEVQEGVFKQLPFTDAQIVQQFYLVYHKDKFFSRALKAFLDMAMEFSKKPWPD